MTDRELTVLYVDASIGFGGSSKSLALTLSGLSGVRPLLITSQRPALVQELFGSLPTWRFRKRINYRTRALLTEWLRERNTLIRQVTFKGYALLDIGASTMALVKLLRIIQRHDVDVIHLNNGYLPREAIWTARLTGVPVVVHLRGVVSHPVAGRILRAASEVDRTIAVSNAAVRHLRAELPDVPITVIHDPVDLSAMAAGEDERGPVRRSLGAADDDVLVGTFGRVVHWKGQMEFARACIQAMEQDPRLLALIVGDASDGSGEYFDEVREVIRASSYADRFVLTGYRPDVEAYYHAVDIAVHASIIPEPFGMVVPEAMAAGRAVIASDEGGPREIITHGVDGLRVAPGDVHALRGAILELAADPERRRELGERARETVERRFTIEQNAVAVRRVYQEIMLS